jgi:hypothetical protein
MLDMNVPKFYWGDALLTATYLINRVPSQVLDIKTHLEVLSPPFSTSNGVTAIVFGCVCFVHVHGPARGKLDPHMCLWAIPLLKSSTNVINPHEENTVSMDATFFETQSYFSTSQTPLQGKSKIEEDFLTPLLIPTYA